jgi:hypothetical protein
MGVVDTTYTFSNTDTITSSKLNNIIDDTFFTSTAISGSSLQIVSPGKLAVAAGGITSNELGSKSVTPVKLSDSDFGDFTVYNGVATIDSGVITPTKLSQPLTSGVAVTASGSSVTFGSIPSWVTKISIIGYGISTNGTSPVYVRVGSSGSLASSGYSLYWGVSTSFPNSDAGFDSTGVILGGSDATANRKINISFSKLNSSNIWIIKGSSVSTQSGQPIKVYNYIGEVSLSGQLDIIGIACGANSFDSGTINAIYQ